MIPSEVVDQEREAAALLDKVLRGEVPLLFPPGTLVGSLLVPCFGIGSVALTLSVGLAISKSMQAFVWSMGAAILLGAVLTAGHVRVVLGRPNHRIWMRIYVESLLGCAVLAGALGAIIRLPVPWILLCVALGAFASCDLLLRSRGYLALSSFLSLKRKYREMYKLGLLPKVDTRK